MNVNFKVLWFEDEMGWRPSSERSMKRIIESHNLVPIITWKKGDEGDAEEELKKAEQNLTKFLDDFIEKIDSNIQYTIEKSNFGLNVNIKNGESGFLIGYRGETLYAFQNILSSVAGKGIENRVRIILDVEGYKEKREKTLEELAEKIAKTVIKTKKSITLEPMQAYERKIIHSKLQNNEFVETRSIGEEPRRKVVVSLKRK